MKKKLMLFLMVLLTICTIACGKSEESTDSSQEEAIAVPVAEEAWETITTPYGDLRYPANLYGDLKREEGMENDVYRMKFSTASEGKIYDLFTLYIGGEVGDAGLLGKLVGKDGTEYDVFVLPYDLGDLSKLDANEQDRIYAMQEALNEVLGE